MDRCEECGDLIKDDEKSYICERCGGLKVHVECRDDHEDSHLDDGDWE